MSVDTDVRRDVTRQILACPYCQRPQAIPPQSVGFPVRCGRCHRMFPVTETGAVADVKAPRSGAGAVPGDPGGRLEAMLLGMRTVVIAVLALVVVAQAIRQLGGLNPGWSAGRRAILEGSMTAPVVETTRVLARSATTGARRWPAMTVRSRPRRGMRHRRSSGATFSGGTWRRCNSWVVIWPKWLGILGSESSPCMFEGGQPGVTTMTFPFDERAPPLESPRSGRRMGIRHGA